MTATGQKRAATSKRGSAAASFVAIAIVVIAAVLAGISGYLNGSLQGELPHATAPDRSSVLVAARSLLWGCLGVVALGTVLSGVMARSGNARLVLTMSVFFGGALLSLLVFVGGYAFGSNPPG